MELKNDFFKRRVTRGYTQQQLCKVINSYGCNCDQAEISNYEQGKRFPNIDKLLIIAKALKCKVEDIYYFEFEQDEELK